MATERDRVNVGGPYRATINLQGVQQGQVVMISDRPSRYVRDCIRNGFLVPAPGQAPTVRP